MFSSILASDAMRKVGSGQPGVGSVIRTVWVAALRCTPARGGRGAWENMGETLSA
eukprot:COSAG06_NODE_24601_length_657_cov_5.908602_1_plen_54_part_10